jgi:hypothetical protein
VPPRDAQARVRSNAEIPGKNTKDRCTYKFRYFRHVRTEYCSMYAAVMMARIAARVEATIPHKQTATL